MKGNTINAFMSDLRYNGGPEKEFVYKNKWFFVEGESKENDGRTYFRLEEYTRNGNDAGDYLNTYWFGGASYNEAVEEFEKTKTFNGKTIYEAEKDIEALFG